MVDRTVRRGVLLTVDDGRFTTVTADAAPGDAHRLAGLTLPGLANAHSHAFHRAMRSRTHAASGTFWSWRELMYRAAERLQPDSYHRLGRAVFAEMAEAGTTCVGEFHYLHHDRDGAPYAHPNAMGEALLSAADEVGIRITLLDTLYLHGGLERVGHRPVDGVQCRFRDADADRWVRRVEHLEPTDTHRIGAAIHSVRAVDPDAMAVVAEWSATRDAPLHAHVSEQPAENEASCAHHGRTPLQVLADAGALTERFSAVHATHVGRPDIGRLADAGATVVMCPTTERDLGDGIGPTAELVEQGVALAVGSDSHAVIDIFEETRAVELDERLRSHRRGVHDPTTLLEMTTVAGHRSLGWDDAGTIRVGGRADLVTVRLDTPRTAGADPDRLLDAVIFAASAGDVSDIVVDGRHIVSDGRHASIDVVAELDEAITDLFADHGASR